MHPNINPLYTNDPFNRKIFPMHIFGLNLTLKVHQPQYFFRGCTALGSEVYILHDAEHVETNHPYYYCTV